VLAAHPEQGWSLLCNGIVLFSGTGLLLPDGQAIPPHRSARHGATGCTRQATASRSRADDPQP